MLSLILQEAPAETSSYMVIGYAVIFTVLAIYLFSMYTRNRNLDQDLQVLEELQPKDK